MKKKLATTLYLFISLCLWPELSGAQPLKIGVISDVHYMAPSLLVEKGKAFDRMLYGDRKLLEESPEILKATVKNLIQEKVNLVLITGDLSKDGESASHEGVVTLLKPLLENGIKVLVVPGNHDINNPHAVSFHGDSTRQEATVSAEEFRAIYSTYGFGAAISQDSCSLSYASEPAERLRVLCIDDCDYSHNLFKSKGDPYDLCSGKGYVKPGTIKWMQQEIADAKSQGKQVIVMMHHNIVEHFDYEHAFQDYMTTNYTVVQKALMSARLTAVFTGHFHATDIALADDGKGHHLFDIETGSIVTYPCPYRIIRLSGDSMAIETKRIEQIDSVLPGHEAFQAYAYKEAVKRLTEIVFNLVDEHYPQLSGAVPPYAASFVTIPSRERLKQLVSNDVLSDGIDLVLAHYCGNENLVDSARYKRDKFQADIRTFIHDVAQASSGMLYPVTEKALTNSGEVKRIMDLINSIWDDKTEPGYPYDEPKGQRHEAVNDLTLTIPLSN